MRVHMRIYRYIMEWSYLHRNTERVVTRRAAFLPTTGATEAYYLRK